MKRSNDKWDLCNLLLAQVASKTTPSDSTGLTVAITKLRNRARRTTIFAVLLLIVCGFQSVSVMANSGGISGNSREGQTCNTCHNGDRFNSVIEIQGGQEVGVGTLNEFIINMTHDGNRGGFNMSASGGSLEAGTGSRKLNGELTHNSPQRLTSGANSWTVQWEAPAEAGNETLFVCGNAVNGNGATSGDETLTACNTLSITVVSLNDSPQAVNDSATIDEDDSVTINVLSNDADPDGSLDSSSVGLVSGANSGTTMVNSNGTITYTPSSNFNGSDSFSYTVADNEGATSNPATVTITVISINDIPVAANDSASTSEDESININVLANDSDVEDTLDGDNIEIQSTPQNGTAQIVGNNVSYAPDANFAGNDSFTYRVNDSDGSSSSVATVSITVVAVNDAPVAIDDNVTTDEDNNVTIEVLNNDSDIDGSIDNSSLQLVSVPSNGSAVVSSGSVIYTPNDDYNGSDSFTYQVADNEGSLSNIASVFVTVNSVNDAPVAFDDVQGTNIDTPVQISVLDNDTDDASLDNASVVIVTEPTNGQATANAQGVITYTPSIGFTGQDSFTYTVDDTQGVTSNEATVSVSVRVNEVPVAMPDMVETDEDQSVSINVLENDSDDIEIDVTSVEIVLQPENGVATATENGTILYQPTTDSFGTDSFTYSVSDFENATSEAALVSITILPVNDAPVFESTPLLSVVQGQVYEYQISVSDVDSEDLIVAILEGPTWLSLEDSNSENLLLAGVPPLDAIGNNDVVLQVSDGQEQTQQSFTVLVSERTDADLAITVHTQNGVGIVGESLVYEVTVSNNGPADANSVQLTAGFEGLTGGFVLPASCDSQLNQVSCIVETVTPDSPVTLQIGFVAEAFGDVVTALEINFSEENDPSNNQVFIARSIASGVSQPVEVTDTSGTSVVALADINGDGFPDMAGQGDSSNTLLVSLNNGRGQLIPETTIELTGTLSDAQFAHLDEDAQFDLLVVENSHTLIIMQSQTNGSYSESQRMTFADITDIAVADLDVDGDMDIVIAQSSAQNRLLLNQGDLIFESAVLSAESDNANSHSVAITDLNGDQFPELIFANGANANSLHINQTHSGEVALFSETTVLTPELSNHVSVIDIDGDGQNEVLFANSGILGSSVYAFVDGGLQRLNYLGRAGSQETLVADLNGDGASDLLMVKESGAMQQWLNDGSGQFELLGEALLLENASGFDLADINVDGFPDLVVASAAENVIFGNDVGSFRPATVDLSLSAAFASELISEGESWSYTLVISNSSDSFDAIDTLVSLNIDDSLVLATIPESCTMDADALICDLGNLVSETSMTVSLEGEVSTGVSGELTISASVNSAVSDSITENNNAAAMLIVNAAPVANNDSAVVEHNESQTINVLANDTDDIGIDSSSVTIVASPANGSASVSASGSVLYTPNTDYAGTDSFTYQVTDSNGVVSNIATVSITVNEKPDDGGTLHYLVSLWLVIMLLVRRRGLHKSQ